jgi:cytoskeletal protein RodZ
MQFKKILIGAIVVLGLSVSVAAMNGTFKLNTGDKNIMTSSVDNTISIANDILSNSDVISSETPSTALSDVSSVTPSETTSIAPSATPRKVSSNAASKVLSDVSSVASSVASSKIASQASSTVSATAKAVGSFEGISDPGTYTIGGGIVMTINSSSQDQPVRTGANTPPNPDGSDSN